MATEGENPDNQGPKVYQTSTNLGVIAVSPDFVTLGTAFRDLSPEAREEELAYQASVLGQSIDFRQLDAMRQLNGNFFNIPGIGFAKISPAGDAVPTLKSLLRINHLLSPASLKTPPTSFIFQPIVVSMGMDIRFMPLSILVMEKVKQIDLSDDERLDTYHEIKGIFQRLGVEVIQNDFNRRDILCRGRADSGLPIISIVDVIIAT